MLFKQKLSVIILLSKMFKILNGNMRYYYNFVPYDYCRAIWKSIYIFFSNNKSSYKMYNIKN